MVSGVGAELPTERVSRVGGIADQNTEELKIHDAAALASDALGKTGYTGVISLDSDGTLMRKRLEPGKQNFDLLG